MNEKNLECYKNKLNEINEKAIKAYKEENICELVSLYGSINYYNGCFMVESLDGFNKEVNKLYEESLIISRQIYANILDIMLNIL